MGFDWSMIMGNTWTDETGVCLFLWQAWGMSHCRDDGEFLHAPGCGTSRVKFDEMISSLWGDGCFSDGWWCWYRCSWFHAVHWYQTSCIACCRWDGVYFMDLSMDYTYMEMDSWSSWCYDESLKNDWWWHEDVHSHGLSLTVGLATQLDQVMGAITCAGMC